MAALANGYPVQYRDSSRSSGSGSGFQRRPSSRSSSENSRTPVRNDSIQLRDFKSDASRVAQAMAGLRIVSGLARLNPWIAGLTIAYELWDLLSHRTSRAINLDMTGWVTHCAASGEMDGATQAAFDCTGIPVLQTISKLDWNAKSGPQRGPNYWYISFYSGRIVHPSDNKFWRATLIGGARLLDPARPVVNEPAIPTQIYPREIPEIDLPPGVDDWQKPIQNPEAEKPPLPYDLIPYRQQNPWRSPVEQSSRGNDIPQPWPGTRPKPDPFRLPRPAVDPVLIPSDGAPGPDINVDPNSPGRIAVSPPTPHIRKPPGKHTKEKKLIIAAKNGATMIIYNGVTETRDFIKALWEGLPLKHRRLPPGYILRGGEKNRKFGDHGRLKKPTPTPQDMAWDIYKGLDHMDWDKALDNVVINELLDRFYGKLGRASAKASRSARFSHGIQLGPLH